MIENKVDENELDVIISLLIRVSKFSKV